MEEDIKKAMNKFLATKPERIIIGEVRNDDEKNQMIQSLTTGHNIHLDFHREILFEVLNDILKESFKDKDRKTIEQINKMKNTLNEVKKFSYF